MQHYDELILKNGGRWDIWASQVALVGRFVDAHLKDLTKVQVPSQAHVLAAPEAASGPRASAHALIWDPTRGGMRMPHLHYAGEIYTLNEAQWAEFSKGALAALTEKLGKAQRVRFEDVMQLTESAAGI